MGIKHGIPAVAAPIVASAVLNITLMRFMYVFRGLVWV
jgi:hypothetical protein